MPNEKHTFSVITSARDDLNCQKVSVNVTHSFSAVFSGSEILFGTLQNGWPVVAKFSAYPKGNSHEWQGLAHVMPMGELVQKPLWQVKNTAEKRGIISELIHGELVENLPSETYRHQIGQLVQKLHQRVSVAPDIRWPEKQSFEHYAKFQDKFAKSEATELQTDAIALPLLKNLSVLTATRLKDLQPVFCHQDVHDGQAIVSGEGQVRLIDFENWATNDPLIDLAYYLFHAIRLGAPLQYGEAFLQGYQPESFSDEQNTSLAFYTLFITVATVYYFHPRGEAFAEPARQTLNHVLQLLKAEWFWKHK